MVSATLEQHLGRGTRRCLPLDDFVAWGRQLGELLTPQAVIALHGDLGAGKTTLVRAICVGLGVHDEHSVTSPTFAIIQQYDTRRGAAIVHVDLYRLRSSAELEQLGWDELVATAPFLIVEWPERALESLPSHTIHLHLSHDVGDESVRCMTVM